MKGLESCLTLPIGMGLPMNNICPFLDIAANLIESQRIKLGIEEPLFKLKKEHYDLGKKILKKLGLPADAWYVTLHIREPGYRGETEKNTSENWRNANPRDYLLACKAVTDAGGWVFRMGDPSMTPLPQMQQVIDYAHTEIRSDWMDVFLGATSRFLIGTASGYIDLPRFFGVPVIFTNCSSSVQYFSMVENDLYLPRLLKHRIDNKYLSFEEYMSPPVSMFSSDGKLLNEGLEFIPNTSEELEAATIEMLQRADGKNSLKPDDDLQKRFKSLAENCGFKYGGNSVKAFAQMSHEFIHKHADLL